MKKIELAMLNNANVTFWALSANYPKNYLDDLDVLKRVEFEMPDRFEVEQDATGHFQIYVHDDYYDSWSVCLLETRETKKGLYPVIIDSTTGRRVGLKRA